jgi:tripartite-type tricarboxylate transporter receptor subunit TctC
LQEEILSMRFLIAVFWFAASAASAQDYPNKPIRVIVPYAAGGLPDTITRLIQPKMADALGQQLVVENRGGAGGISGTEAVAKAAPDGYTLLVADVGQVAINPHIFSKLPYEQKDLTGVSLIGFSALFLTLHPSVPASNFKELISYIKSNPGKVNYGSSGIGSIHHLSMEAMKAALGLDIVHVPYKGMGQAVPALLGGQVGMVPSALPAVEAHVKAGTVKMVAISTAKRSPLAPEIPTIAESGAPGYDFAPEIGLLAPAGTPPAIVARLSAEVAKAVKSPDIVERFRQLGIDPVGNPPEAYNAQIRAAHAKYGQVVKAAGVKAD